MPAGGPTQQELEWPLRAAANSLRGPVDPSDFDAYISPLLLFKRGLGTRDIGHARDEFLTEIEAAYRRFTTHDGCHGSDLRRIANRVELLRA